MNCEEAKKLFADDWNDTLSERDSLALSAHLSECPACCDEMERLRALWTRLGSLPAEEPRAEVRHRFYEALEAYGHGMASTPVRGFGGRRFVPDSPAWRWGAIAAVLVLGVGAGYIAGRRGSASENSAQNNEVSQLRQEVGTMRELVALSLLQQQSAGERLRGVDYAYQAAQPNSRPGRSGNQESQQVLAALLDSVSNDPNVNVRLAAADALRGFGQNPVARQGIIRAIARQSAPLVQVALIDLVVDLKDANAAAELRTLAQNPSSDPAVRERASWALEQLLQ